MQHFIVKGYQERITYIYLEKWENNKYIYSLPVDPTGDNAVADKAVGDTTVNRNEKSENAFSM